MTSLDVTPSQLSNELAAQVLLVISALGLEGKNHGSRFRANCPWAGDDYSKIDIRLKHPIGQWKRWNGDEAGDILDLVAYIEGNGSRDRAAAYRWAKEFLNYDVRGLSEDEKRERAKQREAKRIENERRQIAAQKEQAAELKKNQGRAFGAFMRAKKIVKNDSVWQYLALRGIDLGVFKKQPTSIRLLENEKHIDVETGKETYWDCMVSAMYHRDGSLGAIHRTWIDLSNVKGRYKAPVEGAKKMWPSNVATFIPISRGKTNLPVKDALPKSEIVYLFEGIENALTFSMLRPDVRIDVAGSLSLIKSYPVPNCARELRIGADKFDNEAAQKALAKAVDFISKTYGIRVLMNYAPDDFKDWNDVVMGIKSK